MKANKREIAFKMFDEGKTIDDVSKTLMIKRASGHYYLDLWKTKTKAVKKTYAKRSEAITALVTPTPPQTP